MTHLVGEHGAELLDGQRVEQWHSDAEGAGAPGEPEQRAELVHVGVDVRRHHDAVRRARPDGGRQYFDVRVEVGLGVPWHLDLVRRLLGSPDHGERGPPECGDDRQSGQHDLELDAAGHLPDHDVETDHPHDQPDRQHQRTHQERDREESSPNDLASGAPDALSGIGTGASSGKSSPSWRLLRSAGAQRHSKGEMASRHQPTSGHVPLVGGHEIPRMGDHEQVPDPAHRRPPHPLRPPRLPAPRCHMGLDSHARPRLRPPARRVHLNRQPGPPTNRDAGTHNLRTEAQPEQPRPPGSQEPSTRWPQTIPGPSGQNSGGPGPTVKEAG